MLKSILAIVLVLNQAPPEPPGISFQLDTSGPMRLSSIRDPSKVPAEVRIVSMLLTR